MTRTRKWALQDAKARFSELVRKAKTEGPQRVTVHGRDEVVVVSVDEYRRMKGQPTGRLLVDLLGIRLFATSRSSARERGVA